MTELLTSTFLLFCAELELARTSCVHVFILLEGWCVRKNFSRARFYSFGRGVRSQELFACTFLLFWMGFASARTSCVHVFILLDGGCVPENFSRARFYSFGRSSCSRELLACTFLLFWTEFVFERTSRVHVFTLLDGVRVRENFSRARFYSFGRSSRSREPLTCTFLLFWTEFAFERTSRVHVFTLLDGVRVRENFSLYHFTPFQSILGMLRPSLRYRFTSFNQFQARKTLLELPFHPFQPISGTQGSPRVTVSPFPTNFGHREDL
jgi:hypothetical protein